MSKSAYKQIQGVVPKDMESKKEMMSFIGYSQHLEDCCRFMTFSKLIHLNDGPNDKNRIFISGTSVMSTKMTTTAGQSKKLCDEL